MPLKNQKKLRAFPLKTNVYLVNIWNHIINFVMEKGIFRQNKKLFVSETQMNLFLQIILLMRCVAAIGPAETIQGKHFCLE